MSSRLVPSAGWFLGLHAPYDKRKLAVVLKVYRHDSGSHGGSSAWIVGGYVSEGQRWEHFKKEWARFLARYGVTRLHMKHFVRCTQGPEFEGWTEVRQRRFADDGTRIIRAHRSWSVGAAIALRDFNEVADEMPEIEWHRRKDPAIWCLEATLEEVIRAVKPQHRENIAVVFDTGDEMEFALYEHFDQVCALRTGWKKIFHSITFASISESPLQAADAFAYSIYRWMSEQILHAVDPIKSREIHFDLKV